MIIYIYIYLKIHQIKKKIILKTAEIDKKKTTLTYRVLTYNATF